MRGNGLCVQEKEIGDFSSSNVRNNALDNLWFQLHSIQNHYIAALDVVTELAEHRPHVQTESSVPGRVKTMTYNTDTHSFLERRSALLGYGKDWLVQFQDMTQWNIGHGAGRLISQWDTTITWVYTLRSRCPSWYDIRCCKDVKLQFVIRAFLYTFHLITPHLRELVRNHCLNIYTRVIIVTFTESPPFKRVSK